MRNVLLLAESRDLRKVIKELFRRAQGVCFQGAYSTYPQAKRLAKMSPPLVVFMDLEDRKPGGLHSIPMIRYEHPEAQIIGLALDDLEGWKLIACSLGADDVFPKQGIVEYVRRLFTQQGNWIAVTGYLESEE